MNLSEAWKIVSETGTDISKLTEDEIIIYEEALYHILIEATEDCEKYGSAAFGANAEAGAYNLAAYYEKIEKYELALKYYEISKSFGCGFADGNIARIKDIL